MLRSRLGAAPAGHFFAFRPSSTKRLMASGRDRPGSFCFAIQASIAARGCSSIRTPTTVPVPVVTGRPRLLALTVIDLAIKYRYHKIRLRGLCSPGFRIIQAVTAGEAP
jgi:hypothetical protein